MTISEGSATVKFKAWAELFKLVKEAPRVEEAVVNFPDRRPRQILGEQARMFDNEPLVCEELQRLLVTISDGVDLPRRAGSKVEIPFPSLPHPAFGTIRKRAHAIGTTADERLVRAFKEGFVNSLEMLQKMREVSSISGGINQQLAEILAAIENVQEQSREACSRDEFLREAELEEKVIELVKTAYEVSQSCIEDLCRERQVTVTAGEEFFLAGSKGLDQVAILLEDTSSDLRKTQEAVKRLDANMKLIDLDKKQTISHHDQLIDQQQIECTAAESRYYEIEETLRSLAKRPWWSVISANSVSNEMMARVAEMRVSELQAQLRDAKEHCAATREILDRQNYAHSCRMKAYDIIEHKAAEMERQCQGILSEAMEDYTEITILKDFMKDGLECLRKHLQQRLDDITREVQSWQRRTEDIGGRLSELLFKYLERMRLRVQAASELERKYLDKASRARLLMDSDKFRKYLRRAGHPGPPCGDQGDHVPEGRSCLENIVKVGSGGALGDKCKFENDLKKVLLWIQELKLVKTDISQELSRHDAQISDAASSTSRRHRDDPSRCSSISSMRCGSPCVSLRDPSQAPSAERASERSLESPVTQIPLAFKQPPTPSLPSSLPPFAFRGAAAATPRGETSDNVHRPTENVSRQLGGVTPRGETSEHLHRPMENVQRPTLNADLLSLKALACRPSPDMLGASSANPSLPRVSSAEYQFPPHGATNGQLSLNLNNFPRPTFNDSPHRGVGAGAARAPSVSSADLEALEAASCCSLSSQDISSSTRTEGENRLSSSGGSLSGLKDSGNGPRDGGDSNRRVKRKVRDRKIIHTPSTTSPGVPEPNQDASAVQAPSPAPMISSSSLHMSVKPLPSPIMSPRVSASQTDFTAGRARHLVASSNPAGSESVLRTSMPSDSSGALAGMLAFYADRDGRPIGQFASGSTLPRKDEEVSSSTTSMASMTPRGRVPDRAGQGTEAVMANWQDALQLLQLSKIKDPSKEVEKRTKLSELINTLNARNGAAPQ